MQSTKQDLLHAELWGWLSWSWKDGASLPRHRTVYLQFFLSPLSFCSNMALVMHISKTNWALECQTKTAMDLGGQWSLELWGKQARWKCHFSHPKAGNPGKTACHTVGACIQSCYVFPCLRGGGKSLLYASHPFFPKHCKDNSWPFYRMTVLFSLAFEFHFLLIQHSQIGIPGGMAS